MALPGYRVRDTFNYIWRPILASLIMALAVRYLSSAIVGWPGANLHTINEEHGFTGATHWAATYYGKIPDSGRGRID